MNLTKALRNYKKKFEISKKNFRIATTKAKDLEKKKLITDITNNSSLKTKKLSGNIAQFQK